MRSSDSFEDHWSYAGDENIKVIEHRKQGHGKKVDPEITNILLRTVSNGKTDYIAIIDFTKKLTLEEMIEKIKEAFK